MIFRIIYSKYIAEMYYENIPKEIYQRKSRWDKTKSCSQYVYLYTEDVEKFLENQNFIDFTEDYNYIIKFFKHKNNNE